MIVSIMIVESALIHIICIVSIVSYGHQKWHDGKHYDGELGCCKLLSNWTEAMPILMPCVDTPCEHYITE